MNQIQIDQSVDTELRLRVRASDPLTSVLAAESASEFAGPHKDRIMAALKRLGSGTAHDISNITGLSVVQIDRRLPELKRDGKAEVLTGPSGMDATRDGYRVWAPKKSPEAQQ